MAEIALSIVIILSTVFLIVFLVFKSDNATLTCDELSRIINEDYTVKIKICKKRGYGYGKRNNRR